MMRKIRLLSAALALTMISIAGCEPKQAPVSSDADVSAIEAVIDGSIDAFVARDWDSFAEFFTNDGVWMPPGVRPLTGKDEWWTVVEPWWHESTVIDIDITTEELIVSGDWAIERHAEYQVTRFGPDAEPAPMYFKGSWIFQRQDNGAWKIAQYIWNDNVAPR